MCLIIYSKEGKATPPGILEHACAQNGDGIGVMHKHSIDKFLGKKMLKRAKRHIRALVEAGEPHAIHFRWATHGAVKLINTHPYRTADGLHYVMHNGILSGDCTQESSADESDTAVYVRKYMAEGTVPDFIDAQYWTQMGKHIGWSNKFCVMDSDGNFQLVNESAGFWKEGIWYSNTYSLPARFAYGGYGGGGGTTNYYNWRDFDNDGMRTIGGNTTYNGYDDTEWQKYGGEGATNWKEAREQGFEWDYLTKKWFKRTPVAVALLPRQEHQGSPWGRMDRQRYYQDLERGMTDSEAAEYADTGAIATREAYSADFESGELAALRAEQDRITRGYVDQDKEDSPIGGDFPDALQMGETDLADEPEDDDLDTSKGFKDYLRKIAATIHP